MKNKGFTIIELGVSFCIVTTVAIILFQLVISIKDLYLAGNIKTTLLNKQGIMTKRIYDDINYYQLKSIKSCGISCLTFEYIDPQDSEMNKNAVLMIDPFSKTLTYDEYSIELGSGSSFGKIIFDNEKKSDTENDIVNRILQIKIPIYSSLLDGDYGINLIIQYNDEITTVDNQILVEDSYITLNNINIPIQEIKVNELNSYMYAKIYSQDLSLNNTPFINRENILKSNEENRFSAIFALDLFKGKYHTTNQDVFEFILKYPSLGSEYNRWIQMSNFMKEPIKGFVPLTTAWNANGKWNGLVYTENSCSLVIGTINNECYFGIGNKQNIDEFDVYGDNENILKSKDIELWVRIDSYINNYALSTVISTSK